MIAAIYVVVQVIGTIHKDYSLIEQKEDSSTETAQTIEIEHEEETQGWNETERDGHINWMMKPGQQISGWRLKVFYIILMKMES